VVLRIINIPIGCLLFLVVSSVWALPSSKRLFQSNYGYKVSCNLCHTDGGGSRRNEYGLAFYRSGFNLAAFKKIEKKDSDQDGVSNVDELIAKSNPGDAKSTPTKPGDWLKDADKINIPRKHLLKIFPNAEQFAGVEGELSDAQKKTVEGKLKRALSPEEKVPTDYFSIQKKKRVGVAQMFEVKSGDEKAIVGMGVDTQGVLTDIVIIHGHKSKPLIEYLKRLKGKNLKTLTPEGTTAKLLKEAYLNIVGALFVMEHVFGG
jgi:hypothetical protein